MTEMITQQPAVAAMSLAAALAAVQGELHSVGKDREVEVTTKSGHKYKFNYATLANIWDVIRAPCAKYGIAIVQFPTTDPVKHTVSVETHVLHAAGEKLVNTLVLPCTENDPQKIGAVISYARRYSLSSLLGVTQENENDEEVLNAMREQPQRAPANTRQPPPSQNNAAPKPPPFDELMKRYDEVKDRTALNALSKTITETKGLTKEQLDKLRGKHAAKVDEFKKAALDAAAKVAAPSDTPPASATESVPVTTSTKPAEPGSEG